MRLWRNTNSAYNPGFNYINLANTAIEECQCVFFAGRL